MTRVEVKKVMGLSKQMNQGKTDDLAHATDLASSQHVRPFSSIQCSFKFSGTEEMAVLPKKKFRQTTSA